MTSNWLLIDIETAGRSDAAGFIEDRLGSAADFAAELAAVEHDKRCTKPDAIAESIANRRQKLIDDREQKRRDFQADMGLDWNANRIVALGYQTESSEATVLVCEDEDDERAALRRVWHAYGAGRRRIVGYNVWGFDLPTMIQRSRLLGIDVPYIDMRRYGNSDQIDLFKLLTFDDIRCTSVIRRTLDNFCRLFGIDETIPPVGSGADIGAMVEAGDWDGIRAHCLADVRRTQALAQRLGYISAPVAADVEAVAI